MNIIHFKGVETLWPNGLLLGTTTKKIASMTSQEAVDRRRVLFCGLLWVLDGRR
jgi:hypothetical protein